MGTTIDIYIGFGTQARLLWTGQLDHLPRVGERIYLAEHGIDMYVDQIVHSLATPEGSRIVRIYLHSEKRK